MLLSWLDRSCDQSAWRRQETLSDLHFCGSRFEDFDGRQRRRDLRVIDRDILELQLIPHLDPLTRAAHFPCDTLRHRHKISPTPTDLDGSGTMPDIKLRNQPFDLVFHPSEPVVYGSLLTGEVKAWKYDDVTGETTKLWSVRPTKKTARALAVEEDGKAMWMGGKSGVLW